MANKGASNLLFGLIGHFGLLKDVNIPFFLSFFNELTSKFGSNYTIDD